MSDSARVHPSVATERLMIHMQRAQELQGHFHTQSEQFRHWMSDYHQQMQRYYTKKIGYHEHMEQLYKEQLSDDAMAHMMSASSPFAALTPPPRPVLTVTGDVDTDVTDDQWALIAALLPLGRGRGRPYADDRRTLNGILFVTTRHIGWGHMPPRYGSYVTCWRRYLRWQSKGVWSAVQEVLQETTASTHQDTPASNAAHADNLAYSIYTSS